MRISKLRGEKRKTHSLIKRVVDETTVFPSDFHNGYWHMHLPAAQEFVEHPQLSKTAKTEIIQSLVDRANHFFAQKPDGEQYYVVAAISSESLWDAQLIVFKGDEYYNQFFNRNSKHQQWTPMENGESKVNQLKINIPSSFQVLNVSARTMEEDDDVIEEEILLIGELPKG
ncbi:group-specific protein [Priestia megaterium]|nr:group-specific protein [Priestia megaterium]